MMINYKLVFLFIAVAFFSCGKEQQKESARGGKETPIKVYNYKELAPLLNKKGKGKTYVVNFWATWCKPCVDELPYFEELNADFKDKNIEVLLVSLDFQKEELSTFIKKNKLESKVVLFDDPNQNEWINAIDKSWSGALPATIIYNSNKRAFYEQSFNKEALLKEVHKFLNK